MPEIAPPREAIVAHHTEMLRQLRAHTGVLVDAVGAGRASGPATAALHAYITSTIVPHALAEERTLYPAARRRERRLIDSLMADHTALRRLAGEMATAGEDTARVAAASAFTELFDLHAAKENDLVLPALLEDTGASLGAILNAMHGALAEQPATPIRHRSGHRSQRGRDDGRRQPA